MTDADRPAPPAEMRFDGRVALVTGAGRGIGRAYAMLLAARGASVLVNDLGGAIDASGASQQPARDTAAAIARVGGKARPDFSDVGTQQGCRRAVEHALDEFGTLDIVVNNAGGVRGAWSAMIDLNLSGTFWICEAAWPRLAERGQGRILNTCSSAGLFGLKAPSADDGLAFHAYAAAKMGVVGLTRNLALEGRRTGIKVNAIAPVAASRMTAENPSPAVVRWLNAHFRPERVAEAAAILLHESCPVSGETFSAGGGLLARIVIGETRGHVALDGGAEAHAANLDRVMDIDDLLRPRSTDDEMRLFCERLGIAFPG